MSHAVRNEKIGKDEDITPQKQHLTQEDRLKLEGPQPPGSTGVGFGQFVQIHTLIHAVETAVVRQQM